MNAPSFHHLVKKRLITVNDVVDHIFVADCLEVLSRAMDFGLFDQPELHTGHRAFRFRNEIDMLDVPFVKRNRPVGVVFSDGR